MSLGDWARDSKRRIQRKGIKTGVRDSGYEFYLGLLRRLEPFRPIGHNVFEYEWDLLVLLDSARVDAMQAVEDEYLFLTEPDELRSVGSASYQWMERTFVSEYAEELYNTVYITANHFSEEYLEKDIFYHMEEVWKREWDDDLQTVPPRPVTDATIRIGRESAGEFDRCIVHYMQPHFPSIPDPLIDPETGENEPVDLQRSVWDRVRRGSISMETAKQAYLENLRYVLDDVEVLLENFDAETVRLSADHANAFGEWGVYAHPDVPIDALRIVPWYQTEAVDEHTYTPPDPEIHEGQPIDMEERLRALGYR